MALQLKMPTCFSHVGLLKADNINILNEFIPDTKKSSLHVPVPASDYSPRGDGPRISTTD